MKANRYRIFLYIFTPVLILLALAAESVYFSDFGYHYRTRMFNKSLAAKGMQPTKRMSVKAFFSGYNDTQRNPRFAGVDEKEAINVEVESFPY